MKRGRKRKSEGFVAHYDDADDSPIQSDNVQLVKGTSRSRFIFSDTHTKSRLRGKRSVRTKFREDPSVLFKPLDSTIPNTLDSIFVDADIGELGDETNIDTGSDVDDEADATRFTPNTLVEQDAGSENVVPDNTDEVSLIRIYNEYILTSSIGTYDNAVV